MREGRRLRSERVSDVAAAFYLDGLASSRHGRREGDRRDSRNGWRGTVKIAAVVFAAKRKRILLSGVDDIVYKPFRPQEIFSSMARLRGARFVYSDPKAPLDTGAVPSTALRALPESLRADLKQSVVSLHVRRVAGSARKATEVNRELGQLLTKFAESLEYTAILRALRLAETAERETR